eukprot:SM000009S23521  [mRNA]  locus=s9:487594:490375:+ [translate_table: standard]
MPASSSAARCCGRGASSSCSSPSAVVLTACHDTRQVALSHGVVAGCSCLTWRALASRQCAFPKLTHRSRSSSPSDDFKAEAAKHCQALLNAIHAVFPGGAVPPGPTTGAIAQVAREATSLLPRLHKQAGDVRAAIAAYRSSVSNPLLAASDELLELQKELALLLLYAGRDGDGAPSTAWRGHEEPQMGSDAGEAVLLLQALQKRRWSEEVLEHLTLAFAVGGDLEGAARQYEAVPPGIISRADQWYSLAVAKDAVGDSGFAIDLLRMVLGKDERPHDVPALLLAARICSRRDELAEEGMGYAQRATEHAVGKWASLAGKAHHVAGVCAGRCARLQELDAARAELRAQSIGSLQRAWTLEKAVVLEGKSKVRDGEAGDGAVALDLGLQLAEMRELAPALRWARRALVDGQSCDARAWQLLGLILCAQRRHEDALEACNVGLQELAPGASRVALLHTKCRVQMASGSPLLALETIKTCLQIAGEAVEEVWEDLAEAYIKLKQWQDAAICAERARAIKPSSAAAWLVSGVVLEGQGDNEGAWRAYETAITLAPNHSPTLVWASRMQARLKHPALARTLVDDALRADPEDHLAWQQLEELHREACRGGEADEASANARKYEQTAPALPFWSIPRAASDA